MRRIVIALIAGVVLAASSQLRLGAGPSAGLTINGAGAASVSASTSGQAPPGHSDAFGISGSVSGLYPGASLPLTLTITNREPFLIVVTSISTSVGKPKAGCDATNLGVTQFTGELRVPSGGAAQLTVTATLAHAAPDACQGAVFPLRYAGTALRPGQ